MPQLHCHFVQRTMPNYSCNKYNASFVVVVSILSSWYLNYKRVVVAAAVVVQEKQRNQLGNKSNHFIFENLFRAIELCHLSPKPGNEPQTSILSKTDCSFGKVLPFLL